MTENESALPSILIHLAEQRKLVRGPLPRFWVSCRSFMIVIYSLEQNLPMMRLYIEYPINWL